MIKVGLTGGIGCGKSSVTRLFKQYGTVIIDADQIARELVLPGQPALKEIVEVFGEEYIQEDGQLNRALLKKNVFSNPESLKTLESILHPRINAAINEQMDARQEVNDAYVIVDIPLLVEKGYQDIFDEVIVVDCTPEQQLSRVKQRDKMSESTIQAIIAKQASREERLEIATIKLDNTGKSEALDPQVEALHRRFSDI